MAVSSEDLNKFRDRIDQFFDKDLPRAMEGIEGPIPLAKAWRRALFAAGLAGLDYPTEYGGQDLDPAYVAAYKEHTRGRVPRHEHLFGITVGMALPVIRDYGDHELKKQFLEPGLAGEHLWCQMYSEPGAGSDLASLTTRAELDGDEWIVSGQKVWTSGAQHSQFAILLARTDWDAPKHRGITMFVLPVEQEAVTVRPLVQMTGSSEFNEVFIDEARIPRPWVVGEVNRGWQPAVALLGHERIQTGVASTSGSSTHRSKQGRVPIPVAQLIELARSKGRSGDPLIRQQLAELYSGEHVMRVLGMRQAHPSIGKLWRTRQGRNAADTAAELAFPNSPAWRTDLSLEANEIDDYLAYHVLNCRGMSLGGGSDEIQRNTLGERCLGLPREPGPSRDTPFRELPRS